MKVEQKRDTDKPNLSGRRGAEHAPLERRKFCRYSCNELSRKIDSLLSIQVEAARSQSRSNLRRRLCRNCSRWA